MNTTPMKRCTQCQTEYPATTDYFYPSHLKEGGKNRCCKACHKKHNSKHNNTFRKNLLERAQPVQPEQRSSYWTFNTIAKQLGCTQVAIVNDVYASATPVFKFLHNKHWFVLALTEEDARAYITSKEASLPSDITSPKKARRPVGTPAQCGACGTTEGNIICDEDTITKAWRGYLCAPCHRFARLLRDYLQGDPQRIQPVLRYMKKTSDLEMGQRREDSTLSSS